MKSVQRLIGVSVPESNPGRVYHYTEDGKAMGVMPGGGWAVYGDPSQQLGGALCQRAAPAPGVFGVNQSGPLSFEDIGDEAGLAWVDPNSIDMRAAIDPTAFSAWAVMTPTNVGAAKLMIGAVDQPDAGEDTPLYPRIGFNVGGTSFRVTKTSTITRLQHDSAFHSRLALLMVTFSTREGWRIFDNGVQVAAAPGDRAPFVQGYGVGEWRFFQAYRGVAGRFGLINADLGWAEHAVYRRRIEAFIASKYDLT